MNSLHKDSVTVSYGGRKDSASRGRVVTWPPAMMFCAWIVVSTALYQLDWTYLYLGLRADLVVLLLTALMIFGWIARTGAPFRGGAVAPVRRLPLIALTAYFAAAMVDNGGVPLFQIATGQSYDVYKFGLPLAHIPALIATGYYIVRSFRVYLAERSIRHFAVVLWLVGLLGLAANRGAVSFAVFACAYMFLRQTRLTIPRITGLIAIAAVFLIFFGQFGSARLSHQIHQDTGNVASPDEIAKIAQPTEEYVELGLSAQWLWPYMYAVSPVGNLNAALEAERVGLCGTNCDLAGLAVYELLPDVGGVRIAEALGLEEFDKRTFLRSQSLTASTTFGSAVGYAGVLGAGIVLLFLASLTVGAQRMLRGSPLEEEGLALLATLLFFSFFESMWAYTPMSLQLVLALVASRRIRTVRNAD